MIFLVLVFFLRPLTCTTSGDCFPSYRMNWLDPPREPGDEVEDTDGPEESTLNYWAHRMTPLHDPSPSFEVAEVNQVESETEVVFVACNRVGVEEGACSVGCWSQSVFSLRFVCLLALWPL